MVFSEQMVVQLVVMLTSLIVIQKVMYLVQMLVELQEFMRVRGGQCTSRKVTQLVESRVRMPGVFVVLPWQQIRET